MNTPTIIQAIDDPGLFAPWLSKFNMMAWRVFHAAVFGLPLSPAELGIYRTATGRQRPQLRRAVEVYAPVGRRGGKSANAALLAVYMTAIEIGWQTHLAPGQQAVFPIISVDRQAGREVFNYCRGIFYSSPLLKRMIAVETQESIELTTGAIIQIRTGSFRSVRGPAYIGAVLDELAYFRDSDTAANPASEIIAAISPAIIEGGILFGISSVFNRQGVLYEQFQEHFGRDDDDVLVWKAGTLTMNPGFSTKKIERDRAKDLQVAMAEYESEWRDDISSLFASVDVEAAIVSGRAELTYAPGGDRNPIRYFAFVDPSGGRRDSAALAIAHMEASGRIVVDVARERRAPHQPAEVAAEFAGIMKGFRLRSVTGDRYGGQWPVEAYAAEGIAYELADRTSSELYLAMMPLFADHKVELPDNDRLRNQFLSLMRRTNPGGRDSVVAGQSDGSHSDLANAVAGAAWLAAEGGVCNVGAVEAAFKPSIADALEGLFDSSDAVLDKF